MTKPRKYLYLCLTFILFSGCAYYNTFYNAEKYYRDGLKQKKENRGGEASFRKSIEKCKKMLKWYSGSDWMDDAIFLMGKNYFYLEQHPEARIRFEQLIENFPESEFLGESYLFLGKISLARGDIQESLIYLDKAEKNSTSEFKMDIFRTKLKIYLKQGASEKVIQEGNEYIEKYSEFRYDVYTIMGDAYYKENNYLSALKMYKEAINLRETENEGIRYKLGLIYMEMDSLEKALNVLPEVRGVDSTVVLRGKIQRKLEDYKEAKETLESAKNWRNKHGAVANYELGLIAEKQNESEEALKYYAKAVDLTGKGELNKIAGARKEILEIKKILEPDTTTRDSMVNDSTFRDSTVRDSIKDINKAKMYYRLGEIYYIELNNTEYSISEYKKVYENFPESKYAPKSLYALTYIFINELKDFKKAELYYSKLVSEYPETEYAKEADEEFEIQLPDTTGTGK